MIEIVTVLVSLATISVFLRFVARFKRRIKLGADDYLCVLSLFLLYGMLAELILCKNIKDPQFDTRKLISTQGALLAATVPQLWNLTQEKCRSFGR